MSTTTARAEGRAKTEVRRLPLEGGDRLTRPEFERRYEAMPHLKKAELIDGIVYVGSPVRWPQHGTPHSHVIVWLGAYRAATPGTELADNATVRLDQDNEPQPDVSLRIEERCGGQSRIDEDGYLDGSPELVAEVAASSASYDCHAKLAVYRRHGVREYVVWRVLDGELDWHQLREGRYERLLPDEAGVLRSQAFPGLWLDGRALLDGDLGRVLARLQEGVRSDEHGAFVRRLQDATGAVPGGSPFAEPATTAAPDPHGGGAAA